MTPEFRELLKQAIAMIEEEREITFVSNEVDGLVHDAGAKADLRRFDRWLKKAREAITS